MKGFLPLEAHFVHSDTKGHLAVLAVMFDVGEENEAHQHIIDQAPADKNQTLPLDKVIDIASSFSTSKHYYRFSGSLPPSSLSSQQLDRIKSLLGTINNRPTKPLNGRMVVQ